MKLYLVGIGGTGSRCLEAFIHLCGAGLLQNTESGEDGEKCKRIRPDDINILYIDADKKCGNIERTQDALDSYNKAIVAGKQKHFDEVKKTEYGTFQNQLKVLNNGEVWSPVENDKKTLDDILNEVEMDEGLKQLYHALFTQEERNCNLDKGFRAHPSIGAAAMSLSLNAKKSPWKEVLQGLKEAGADGRIFVFGSVFGGTGASGVPTVAKILDKELRQKDGEYDADTLRLPKIGGALILPYFTFTPDDDEDKSLGLFGNSEDFILNTKSALDYYHNGKLLNKEQPELSIFDSLYLVGNNKKVKYNNFALGQGDQKNRAYIVELYAALAAFDFFNKDFNQLDDNRYNIELPTIARNSDAVITWDDIPKESSDKIQNFIKFLYVYKHYVYPWLEEGYGAKKSSGGLMASFRQIFGSTKSDGLERFSWYKPLVIDKNIDVRENVNVQNDFDSLNDYAKKFFVWLKDIDCPEDIEDGVELVDASVFAEDSKENDVNLDKVTLGKEVNVKNRQYIIEQLGTGDIENSELYSALMQSIYRMCNN